MNILPLRVQPFEEMWRLLKWGFLLFSNEVQFTLLSCGLHAACFQEHFFYYLLKNKANRKCKLSSYCYFATMTPVSAGPHNKIVGLTAAPVLTCKLTPTPYCLGGLFSPGTLQYLNIRLIRDSNFPHCVSVLVCGVCVCPVIDW